MSKFGLILAGAAGLAASLMSACPSSEFLRQRAS
jgi:hypothetical protein